MHLCLSPCWPSNLSLSTFNGCLNWSHFALQKADPLHRVSLPHSLIHMTEWILDTYKFNYQRSQPHDAAQCRMGNYLAQLNPTQTLDYQPPWLLGSQNASAHRIARKLEWQVLQKARRCQVVPALLLPTNASAFRLNLSPPNPNGEFPFAHLNICYGKHMVLHTFGLVSSSFWQNCSVYRALPIMMIHDVYIATYAILRCVAEPIFSLAAGQHQAGIYSSLLGRFRPRMCQPKDQQTVEKMHLAHPGTQCEKFQHFKIFKQWLQWSPVCWLQMAPVSPSFPLKSPHDGLHIRTRRKWGLGSFTLSNGHLEGTMMYQKQHDSCSFSAPHPNHPRIPNLFGKLLSESSTMSGCLRLRSRGFCCSSSSARSRMLWRKRAWATQCATQRGAKSWRQWEKGAHRVCTPEGLLSEYCSIMFDSSSGPHRVGWVRVREVLEFHPVELSSSSSSGLSLDGVWARVRVVMPKGVESEVKFIYDNSPAERPSPGRVE